MLSSTLVVTTDVRMMDTDGLLLLLLLLAKLCLVFKFNDAFFSEDDEGKGDDDPDRQCSGSTKQAVGVSRSMLCFVNRCLRSGPIFEPTYPQSLQILSFLLVAPKCSA